MTNPETIAGYYYHKDLLYGKIHLEDEFFVIQLADDAVASQYHPAFEEAIRYKIYSDKGEIVFKNWSALHNRENWRFVPTPSPQTDSWKSIHDWLN